jgi:hypothetical protein
MFWSKIWFFLVAVVAGVTLTLALVMPRPAERATLEAETNRLSRACVITDILLRDFARNRIQLAGDTARVKGLDTVLLEASKGDPVPAGSYSTAKKILTEEVGFGTIKKGGEDVPYRPDLILALDARGRVVSRSGGDENLYGDSLAGYFLVDDALDGYLRDDLWILGGQLYLVAAAPVVTAREPEWAGAIVLGEAVDREFASQLAAQLNVHLTFYAAGEAVAASDPAQIHEEMLTRAEAMLKRPAGNDCRATEAFTLTSGEDAYSVLMARLPGEAGAMGAFYSVFIAQEKAIGFSGTIKAVTKDDLSFSHFPWVRVAVVFLLMVGVGIALMIFEADQPLRRLSADLVLLAKGERERLAEEEHRGKFGSIARSVNIALDKSHRETRAAKRDLDNLLGPMPEDGAGAAHAAPVITDMSAAFTPPPAPPPPSAFRFSEAAARAQAAPPAASAPLGGSLPSAGFAFDASGAQRSAPTDDRTASPPGAPKRTSTPPARAPTPRPPVPRSPMAGLSPVMDPNASGSVPVDDFMSLPGATGRTQQISIEDEDEATVVAGHRAAASVARAGGASPAEVDDGPQYRAIFDEFVALKRRCGESTDNLTFDRFLTKLRSNRDALIAKHRCRSVKFQVYVKDGKAALKASPVR